MKEKISGIYCFENNINGKKYIGQSEDLIVRFKIHKNKLNKNKDGCPILQKAWNKYGEENFSYYVLEECQIKDLDKNEIFWIKELHSHVSEWGYNISWGGNTPMRGRSHSEETKRKIGDKHLGKIVSEETRLKQSEYRKGRLLSEETKQKIGDFMRSDKNPNLGGKMNYSEETLKRLSDIRKLVRGELHPMFGKHWSEEAKKHNSEAKKGKPSPHSEEQNKNISLSLVGKSFAKNPSSKYVGVSFFKTRGTWRSRISYMGETICLGYFATEEEAAIAYNNKMIELYGENARLNIIEEKEE